MGPKPQSESSSDAAFSERIEYWERHYRTFPTNWLETTHAWFRKRPAKAQTLIGGAAKLNAIANVLARRKMFGRIA